jgi:hypothetical protein
MMKRKLIISLFLLTNFYLGYSQSYTIGEEYLIDIPVHYFYLDINRKVPDLNQHPHFKSNGVYRAVIAGDTRKKIVSDVNCLKKFSDIIELWIKADLQEIPEVIFELPNLKKIRIIGHKNWDWDVFFEKLSKVKQLRSLEIKGCCPFGGDIPISICKMTQLERLEIDGDLVENLPDSFNLKRLKYLRINNSSIRKLPNNFISDSLQYLDLSNNSFNGIPKELKNFKNLLTLNFDGNKYFNNDSEILCLNSKICHLSLTSCGLDRFPIDLCCLHDLKTLNLYGNRISIIPEEILCFDKLKYLFIVIYPSDSTKQIKYFRDKMPFCNFVDGPNYFND